MRSALLKTVGVNGVVTQIVDKEIRIGLTR